MKPYASRIVKDLGPFLLMTTEDTLSLVLEALSIVLDVDKASWLDPDLAHSITVAVLEVWRANRKGTSMLSPGLYKYLTKPQIRSSFRSSLRY
jgi:importin-9